MIPWWRSHLLIESCLKWERRYLFRLIFDHRMSWSDWMAMGWEENVMCDVLCDWTLRWRMFHKEVSTKIYYFFICFRHHPFEAPREHRNDLTVDCRPLFLLWLTQPFLSKYRNVLCFRCCVDDVLPSNESGEREREREREREKGGGERGSWRKVDKLLIYQEIRSGWLQKKGEVCAW